MSIRKIDGKKGKTWTIDYYDPDGKRIQKRFKKKKDALFFGCQVVCSATFVIFFSYFPFAALPWKGYL